MRPDGCVLCGSTWGNVVEEIDGQRMVFCCERCVRQVRQLIDRLRAATGWTGIDELEIEGDRAGRICRARSGVAVFRCRVAFNSAGDVRSFLALPGAIPPEGPPTVDPGD